MGASFRLEHANIMAYVTSRSSGAPRVLREHLHEYLEVLVYRARDYLIPERGFEPWPEHISGIARQALERLNQRADGERGERGETVAPPQVERLLEGLRSEFSDFPVYALAVGGDRRLRDEAEHLARMPLYGNLLVLIPDHREGTQNFEVLDPIPVFSRALHSIQAWPGFLFWTTNGASAFVSLDHVGEMAAALREAAERRPERGVRRRRPWPEFGGPGLFDEVLRRSSAPPVKQRRLLHLSDLHFGTNHALENQAMLEAELREVVSTVDRVVITGDLFDSPKANYATMFGNFRNAIMHLSRGREPIVIPGNHDQRLLGNVGRDFEFIAAMATRKVVVDDDCEMIFACFNSSERGNFARGKIPQSQFRALGGEYRAHISSREELRRYLPMVLVHHHPFSFDVRPETWVQRALAAFGLREEMFLEMVNAAELHRWCADWNIRTILHGHKHKAKYIVRAVTTSDVEDVDLTAIGCGSSLGAEGSPVSYNLLEWDPGSQRWVASIFESVNGGAFRERLAAVSPPTVDAVGVSA